MKISKRHLAKSLTWRFIGTIDTFVFTWLITGNIEEGINLSAITTITKLIWYYMHERLWFNSSIADSNKRHIIKTFSWRGIGTLDTIIFSSEIHFCYSLSFFFHSPLIILARQKRKFRHKVYQILP